MQKNVSGQKVGTQMTNASDNSAFTGSVTVYVTGDGGTQAIGTVGSGVCTHEGNGYHTYTPSQAETNYDLVAFTFVGTGAKPVTVSFYTGGETAAIAILTSLPENFASMLITVGGVVSADVIQLMGGNVDYITGTGLEPNYLVVRTKELGADAKADVNAEVVDVLATDTFSELSAPPAATSSLKDKLSWIFMWFRNKSTETATQRKLFADDTTTVVSTEIVSDDNTTYTKGEAS